jgi:hypothetical protein
MNETNWPRLGGRGGKLNESLDKHSIRHELQHALGGQAGPAILEGWPLLRVCRLALDTVLRDDHECSYLDAAHTDGEEMACAACDEKESRLRAIVHPESEADDELEPEPEAA